MQFTLFIKPIIAYLNKIFSLSWKSKVDTYISNITANVEGVKVYSDIFPNTNINVVVVTTDSDTVPNTLQPYLQPNDNIATFVITSATVKNLLSITDIRLFVVSQMEEKLSTFIDTIQADLITKVKEVIPGDGFLQNLIIDMITTKLSKTDLVELLVAFIKSKITGSELKSFVSTSVLEKIASMATTIATHDVKLVTDLFANLYGAKINAFLETKFKDLHGKVQVF